MEKVVIVVPEQYFIREKGEGEEGGERRVEKEAKVDSLHGYLKYTKLGRKQDDFGLKILDRF